MKRLALLLLAGCNSSSPPPASRALAPIVSTPDPCRDDFVTADLVDCPVGMIDDALAAVLSARRDRDKVTLEFQTTEPEHLATVAKVPWVRHVAIVPEPQDGPLADLRELKALTHLRTLELFGIEVREVEDAWIFTELVSLRPEELGTIDLSGITALKALRHLHLIGSVTNLGALEQLHGLETLILVGPPQELAPLVSLSNLKSLTVSVTKKTDLAPLGKLTSLEVLEISGASIPALTRVLEPLPNLRRLFLKGDQKIDTKPLARLTRLELLDFGTLPVTDIRPLKALPRLERLSFRNGQVDDLRVLLAFPALKSVELPVMQDDVYFELHDQRPDLF